MPYVSFAVLALLALLVVALAQPRSAGADCIPALVERVHDGDTLRATIDGRSEPVRLLGIDTPEIGDKARCPAEQAKAVAARDRLRALVAAAGDRRLCTAGRDRYDRVLASLLLDGQDASERLIAEGLGRPYDGGRREGWCP